MAAAAAMLLASGAALAQGKISGDVVKVGVLTDMSGLYSDVGGQGSVLAAQMAVDDFGGKIKGKKIEVEGHKLAVAYKWAGSSKKPSSLQVIRNYENAIKKIGGSAVYQRGDDFLTLQLTKNGRETWAEIASEVDAGWGGFILTIIEREVMVQEVTANAAAMSAGIRATGHVAVYGINFDADKAEIKPEADAVISEIAKLLTQDAGLMLFVVGHTANVGDVETGLKLSQARAQAVVKRLVEKYGISAARLAPFGAGPYCPVSTNQTEEGRAKNRRVELVQR